MPDEVTFIDLATITRITPDTTLEKLGSIINASIFDASNLAGALKQKGLIDFMAYYPGPNTIKVTDQGKALMTDADAKALEPFDSLDHEILKQLSGGKRAPADIQKSMNVRPKDLALRLYKLSKQGYTSYELRSGSSEVSLTESGFLKAKSQFTPISPQPQYTNEPMKYVPAPPSVQAQPKGSASNPAMQPPAPQPQQPTPPAYVQAAAAAQQSAASADSQHKAPANTGGGIPKLPIALIVIIIVLVVLYKLKVI